MERKDTGLGVVYKLDPLESQIVKQRKPELVEDGLHIIAEDTRRGAMVVVYFYEELSPDADHKYTELEEFATQERFQVRELAAPREKE